MLEQTSTVLPLGDADAAAAAATAAAAAGAAASTSDAAASGATLHHRAAEMALALDSLTLPFRRAAPPPGSNLLFSLSGRPLRLGDWCGALAPRISHRVLAADAWAPALAHLSAVSAASAAPAFAPFAPAATAGPRGWFSRVEVGRCAAPVACWPGAAGADERRAVRFQYAPPHLPRTFPAALFAASALSGTQARSAHSVPRSAAHVLYGVGACDGLQPWLQTLAAPLGAHASRGALGADLDAAKRGTGLCEDDAAAIAEDMRALADGYGA